MAVTSNQEIVYAGILDCGCALAAVVQDRDNREMIAVALASWVRAGLTVVCVPAEAARDALGRCRHTNGLGATPLAAAHAQDGSRRATVAEKPPGPAERPPAPSAPKPPAAGPVGADGAVSTGRVHQGRAVIEIDGRECIAVPVTGDPGGKRPIYRTLEKCAPHGWPYTSRITDRGQLSPWICAGKGTDVCTM